MPAKKFDDIYKDMKNKIETETYAQGEMLPSENQLTEEYACSRNTVRRAIAMLASMGYVQPVHGKGVQIIYHPISQTAFTFAGIETFAETAKRNHLNSQTITVRFADMYIDERMQRKTGFALGTEVFYIQRVRYLDKKPVILDVNVFLKSEMPGLTKDISEHSIYQYLENVLGMQIVTSNRSITAERATQIDHKYLELQDYDFVSVITSQTYNSKGIMFEWTQSRHRPDYFRFYDTVTRKKKDN